MIQCERLLKELEKGRKLTQRQMFDELHIGNHTGRISDLRAQGYRIKCEEVQGEQGPYGLYSLENGPLNENLIEFKAQNPNVSWYECARGHREPFYGIGRMEEPCSKCNFQYKGKKVS